MHPLVFALLITALVCVILSAIPTLRPQRTNLWVAAAIRGSRRLAHRPQYRSTWPAARSARSVAGASAGSRSAAASSKKP